MQNSDYRSRFAVSQSALKQWNFKSPSQWYKIYIEKQLDPEKDESSFIFGSLIDIILFSPDKVNDYFYVGQETLPSKAIAWIIKHYYESLCKYNQESVELNKVLPEDREFIVTSDKLLLEAANLYQESPEDKVGWNTGWKEETRLRTLTEKGNDYLNSLRKAEGRKVISHEMNLQALVLRDILYTNTDVKDYFVENEYNKLLFQLEIFIDYPIVGTDKTLPLKGALDIVRFNHLDKTVQIIDFKSSYSAFGFLHSIKQFGYCFQLSFYDFLLREWLKEYCNGDYCDYKVLAPINIVIDIHEHVPYIYSYTWRDIALEADGNSKFLFDLFQTYDHPFKIKKGWKKLLEEVSYHYYTNNWTAPKELLENKKIMVNLLN